MHKAIKLILPMAGGLLAAGALTAFLVAPGRADEARKAPFLNRNFAHRGLHSPNRSVPENSLAAFRAAVEKGYGVEMDVRITRDDRLVVFHDDSLDRACGVKGKVEDKTWAELDSLRLFGTEERIPLLREALDAVDAKTPVIIELKRGGKNKLLCRLALEEIDSYFGPVCVESFDPFIVRWFRQNAPDILRGQLTNNPKSFGGDTSKLERFVLGNVLTNFLSRPHFISHGMGKKTPLCRLSEVFGAMKFSWTSHSRTNEAKNDAVIFEYYAPAPKFR